MTLSEFVTAQTGQNASFPDCTDNQCMTLMHLYVKDVLGIEDPATLAEPSAFMVFQNFPNVKGADHFTAINNTPDNIPEAGDIMVWDNTMGGGNGHIATFLSGDVNTFKSFDCNWPEGSLAHEEEHTYDHVLGWLHPITPEAPATPETPAQPDPNAYPYGLDLTNPDTVKVCVDLWKAIEDKKYVPVEKYDELETKFNELTVTNAQLQEAHDALPGVVKTDIASKIVKFFDNL